MPSDGSGLPLPAVADLGPRFFEFLEQLQRPVVFFDLESTGTDHQHDRIIEISLVRVSPLPVGIEKAKTWRINPGMKIPSESIEIHGITDADVGDCPKFAEVVDDFFAVIEGADLAGFSISRMDIRMLQAELHRAERKSEILSRARLLDAQVIFHRREPRNLSAAMEFYRGRKLEGAHGAEADALASLEVFAGQLERYPDLATDMDSLHELSTALDTAYVDSGRRFIWKNGEPAFNFGKLRGKSLRWAAGDPHEREYLKWILQGTFEDDTKEVVSEALQGKIRRREVKEESQAD